MKTITLNNKVFEIKNSIRVANIQRYDSIFDAYKKPSATKIKIWTDLIKWFYSCPQRRAYDEMYITSASCFLFTVVGTIQGHKFCITKNKNFIQLQSLEDVTIK